MNTYKIGQFAKLVRRTPATIRRWEAEGKIASKRLPSDHRYYDDADLQAVLGVKPERKLTVVYCRVSSRGQKADLQRQLEAMEMWALGSGTAVDEWITEIGGGMNFKRPQVLNLNFAQCLRPVFFKDQYPLSYPNAGVVPKNGRKAPLPRALHPV